MLLLALAGVVAYVVIKLDVFAPSLSEQVSSIQKADGSWWLGTTFGVLMLGIIQTLISFDGTLSSWWTRIVVGVLLFVFCLLQRLFTAGRAAHD